MSKALDGPKITFLICLVVLAGGFCQADQPQPAENKAKYIGIDEIRPGMKAYCLTSYRGTEIEKFDMEVLDVVRNIAPGRNAILVQGTDPRFIHTGPVAGCSGSPVYINDRLAGALAFGWVFSKDPLYGVTPIEEILRVGKAQSPEPSRTPTSQTDKTKNLTKDAWEGGFSFDFSKPIDFAQINRVIATGRSTANLNLAGTSTAQTRYSAIGVPLPCPLITSGLSAGVCGQLGTLVEPFGLMAVSGVGGGSASASDKPQNAGPAVKSGQNVQLVPGACLVIPLVSGDVTMEVVGTVTEVKDDKIYALGHSFLGYGAIDLPIATGQVHTVVSNVIRSFKFASSIETVGALTTDEATGVCGLVGAKASTIPLTIRVDRYNDLQKRVYNCQLANNKLITPVVLGPAVAGASLMLGDLPPDNTIEYKVTICTEDTEPITFKNVSTDIGLAEMITESVGSVGLLLNNPYKKVGIKSIDFDVRIMPKSINSHIWSVDLSHSTIKADQKLDVTVIVESALTGKKKYQFSLQTPQNLAPGKYDLLVCGGYDYQRFLLQNVPYRFIPENLPTLVEAINNILHIGRDRLYCLLVLPPGGVAVEKAELPDLPATKVLVLQDSKRTLRTQAYSHWLEDSLETGTVVVDRKVIDITVEK